MFEFFLKVQNKKKVRDSHVCHSDSGESRNVEMKESNEEQSLFIQTRGDTETHVQQYYWHITPDKES